MKRLLIRAQPADWASEARALSAVLAGIPSLPPIGVPKAGRNYLAALAFGDFISEWPLPFSKAKAIVRLHSKLAWHLSHRLREHYRVRPQIEDRRTGLDFIFGLDAAEVGRYLDQLEAQGVSIKGGDAWAVRAYAMLSKVFTDRFVSDDWKHALPLAVASIGGESVSRAAIRKAKKLRGIRPNELRDAKFSFLAADPDATNKAILEALKVEGPVYEWTQKRVEWIDSQGTSRVTKTGTFMNWKPRPK